MVVVAVAHLLVTGTALAEIVPLDNAGVLEQLDRAIDGRDRDLVVDRDTAAIQFLDVRVILRFRQHARNDPALLGHAHAGGSATRLDSSSGEHGIGFEHGHFKLSPRWSGGVIPTFAAFAAATDHNTFCHRANVRTSHAASGAHPG